MINGRFDEITKEDILALVQNERPEGRTLEYKAMLPGNSNDDKKEFLADVSSFANAAGGDLIYGISEARDGQDRNTGLPEEAAGLPGISADAEILRLESMIRTGIEPRIPGIHARSVDGFPEGPVIILRVPNSWAAPHMVIFRNWSRFFSRTSNGKYQLDVTEIRAAFALSEAVAERIARFRDERIGKIIANATPVSLEPTPKVVLHVLPVSAFDPGANVDVARSLPRDARTLLSPLYSSVALRRHNLDGYLAPSHQDKGTYRAYLQLFRTGAIEVVEAALIYAGEGRKGIPTEYLERALNRAVPKYLQLIHDLELGLPVFVFLTFVGVRDYEITSEWFPAQTFRDPRLIDRDVLLLPEVVVEDFNVESDQILKPLMDTLWQSAGWERCLHYDMDGNWQGRK